MAADEAEGTDETADDASGEKPRRRAAAPKAARGKSRGRRSSSRRGRGRDDDGGGRSRAAVVLLAMLGIVVLAGGGFVAYKLLTKEKLVQLQLVHEFGGCGKNDGQFDEPRDLAVDSKGDVWVVDMRNYRLQKFAPDGRLLAKVGRQGAGPGEFNDATGIAIDPSDNVYIADMGNGRIQKLDRNGKYVAEWKGDKYRWYGPRDVGTDPEGNVLVSDTGNGKIVKVSTDGEILKTYGGFGDKKGRFNNPVGVTSDRDGGIYVADTCNRRVQRLTKDGPVSWVTGKIRSFPKRVPQPLCEPYVAVAADGTVYVTEPTARPSGGRGEGGIRIYDADGKFLGRCERPRQGSNFSKPMGIAVDKQGNIWVVNHSSCTVQKFAPFNG